MPAVPQILLVQSSPKIRAFLRETLEHSGYTCITEADSGLAAVRVLSSNAIDLVITDIEIGELDGWKLTRMIRSGIYKCAATIPIIVVTQTWCERIAEITGREFGISQLLHFEDQALLPQKVQAALKTPTDIYKLPRVLIIEDNPDTAQVVNRVLRQRFQVDFATDGEAGLAAWKAKRHDLVLLDVMLPKMSGPQVLRQILQIHPSQPVVIMTAHSTMELAEELILEGAVDFISKPFRAEQLRRVCELAARREDYLVSNAQFAAKAQSLQKSTEAYRRISDSHMRLLDNLSTVVLEIDEHGRLQFLNRAWTCLTGFSIEESLGKKLISFLPLSGEGDRSIFDAELKALLAGESNQCSFELRLSDKQGRFIWCECKLDGIETENGAKTIFGCLDNISDRKNAQRELEFLAMHDSLTGLHNRNYFDSLLRQMAATSTRGASHTLVYIDLDHFKVINDTFGHDHGDSVLQEVSLLLRSRLRQSDILCRIGGDEFAVLLANTDIGQAQPIAEELRKRMQGFQYRQEGQHIEVGASMGLCEIDGQASNAGEYLKRADIALYVAKRRGRNLVHSYNPEDRESEELRNSVDWARRFRNAMADGHLLLHFQPVLEIKSGQIAHYEALIRMNLPDQGMIPPGVFIPALERASEMAQLDHWVIRRTIGLLKEFPALNRVAINLSAQAFRDENLVTLVEGTLKEHQIEPNRIIFELTESASMANVAATQRMINSLLKLGCSFSLDDFGTGFSTFSYLKQFPADSIKLDGSLIAQLDSNPEDLAMVRAISDVARTLGKKTVAEFVENVAVLELLREIGIDYAQGYHIGRPVPIEQIIPAIASVAHPA